MAHANSGGDPGFLFFSFLFADLSIFPVRSQVRSISVSLIRAFAGSGLG